MKLAEAAKEKINSSRFFEILYANQAERYRELSQKRVKVSQFKGLMKNVPWDNEK